jgi:hypothetical protein
MDDEPAVEELEGGHVTGGIRDEIVDRHPAGRPDGLGVGQDLRHAGVTIEVVLDPLEDADHRASVGGWVLGLVEPHLRDHEALLVDPGHGIVAAELIERDAAVGGGPGGPLTPEHTHLPGAALVDQDQSVGRVEVVVVRDDCVAPFEEADRRAGQHRCGDERRDREARESEEDVAPGHDVQSLEKSISSARVQSSPSPAPTLARTSLRKSLPSGVSRK